MSGPTNGGGESRHARTLTISAAAEIAGMHAQTLRTYDRLGLVVPARTPGRGRRYSYADVEVLREIQRLSLEGISLEGIRRILELERRILLLEEALEQVRDASDRAARFFSVSADGDVEPLPLGRRPRRRAAPSRAIVPWRG